MYPIDDTMRAALGLLLEASEKLEGACDYATVDTHKALQSVLRDIEDSITTLEIELEPGRGYCDE